MLKSKLSFAVAALLAGFCLAVALAACGSSGSSSSTTADSGAEGPSTGSGGGRAGGGGEGCGKIPTRAPADPDGVIAKLPKPVQAAYNLYSGPVSASAWADWKPPHPGPYKIFLGMGNIGGDGFSELFIPGLEKIAAESPLVEEVIPKSANYEVQTQIEQIQQAIRDKVDLMIVFPLSPSAIAPAMEEAGKAGIPVIAPLAASENRYTVGINGNENLQGAAVMSALASIMGNKGNMLQMEGVPGVPANDGVIKGVDEVLEECPEINVAGKTLGKFVEGTAKTQTLQFLAAHPQPVEGAVQVGGMAVGIIQGFEQTGREVPPIGDVGATPGALAYWSENQDSYEGVAVPIPVGALGEAAGHVAIGMLEGRGMKISEILQSPLLVTNENLEEWVDPSWTISTPLTYAPGPPNVFYQPEYLEDFFVKAAK